MGVSGGLVPCPEALGVMLIAVGLGRIGLGVVLIVAMVRFRGKLDRLVKPKSTWQGWLPLVSAVVVTVLGVGVVLKGLMSYF